jgi:flagellar basal body rod protein FlgG
MQQGIHSTASGALSALRRLDAIANNLANASTPGFKAQLLVQQAAQAGRAQPSASLPHPINRSRLQTDFTQGQLTKTGEPLHVALAGDGFFVTAGAGGERLTRRGSFALDPEGFVEAGDGRRVQGDRGDISLAQVLRGGGGIEISGDGTIRVAGTRVDRIRVVSVADPQALERDGGTGFVARSEVPAEMPAGGFEVRQGALEGSNVSPMQSLVALVEATRGFEAYMTAASRMDDASARAANEVSRV